MSKEDPEPSSSGSGGKAERGSTFSSVQELQQHPQHRSELYKVLFFGLLYTVHAWRSYHEAVCGEGATRLGSDTALSTPGPVTAAPDRASDSYTPANQDSPQLHLATASPGCWYGSDYPCPPASARLRLCFHALRPGVLYVVPFFRPPNPADLHDGLSMAFFMVGALLCLRLAPPTAEGRRSSNLVLCWLVLLVAVPKGWLLAYGWAHPSASLGRAVERVLPSHAAMALWLSLAFPLTWRRQVLLSAVYACAFAALTAMAAARGWPYGNEVSPAAIVARCAAAGGAAVVVSYWAERRRNHHRRRLAQAQAQADTEGQRVAAPATAVKGLEALAVQTRGVLEQSGAVESEAQPQSLRTVADTQPTVMHDKTAVSIPSSLPPARSSPPASSSPTPAPAPPTPHQLPPLPTDLPALVPALPPQPRRRPQYRSRVQGTCVRIKVPGVHARDLAPQAPLLLAEQLAGSGLMLAGMAVREGCMEVVLEIERVAPSARGAAANVGDVGSPHESAHLSQLPLGHEAAGAGVQGPTTRVVHQQAASTEGRRWGLGGRRGGPGSSSGSSGVLVPPGLIRSLVSVLVSAVLPRSARPAAGTPALDAPATEPAITPPPPVSASPPAEGRFAGASGPAGMAAGEGPVAGETTGDVPLSGWLAAVPTRRRLGSPVPIQVDVNGVRYLLAPDRTAVYDMQSDADRHGADCYDRELGGSGGSLGSFDGDGWRMWIDAENPEDSRPGEGKAEGKGSPGEELAAGALGGAAGVFPPHGSLIALQPPVLVLPTVCLQQPAGVEEAQCGGEEGSSSHGVRQAGLRSGVRLTLLVRVGGAAGDGTTRQQEQGGLRHVPLACEQLVAWQRGCFVRVFAVEEGVEKNEEEAAEPAARAREERTTSGGASGGGPVVPSSYSIRRFNVYLEPRDLSYGLLTFGVHQIRGPLTAQPPAPASDPAAATAAPPAGGYPAPELGPLCAIARVLLLPPGLAPLAHELSAPLVEDLDAALQLGDPDSACSVLEFLTDLSEWLRDGTPLLDSPCTTGPGEAAEQGQTRQMQQEEGRPQVQEPGRRAASGVGSRGGSVGQLVDSLPSSADSTRASLARVYSSSTPTTSATDATTTPTTTTAATTGPCSAEGASPGVRTLRASNSGSLVDPTAYTLAQRPTTTATSTAARHAPAAGGVNTGTAPHGEELPMPVMLPGGRLDLRAAAFGMGWNGRTGQGQQQLQQEHEQQQGAVAAASAPTDPVGTGGMPLGTQNACREGLLEYAVHCGWQYTVRLLLGLETGDEGGQVHAGGGGARGVELARAAALDAGAVGANEDGAAVAVAVGAGVAFGRIGAAVQGGERGDGGGGRLDSWCEEGTGRATPEQAGAEHKREQQQQQGMADAIQAPLSATTAAQGPPGT